MILWNPLMCVVREKATRARGQHSSRPADFAVSFDMASSRDSGIFEWLDAGDMNDADPLLLSVMREQMVASAAAAM